MINDITKSHEDMQSEKWDLGMTRHVGKEGSVAK